jgi:hypothetical protein
MTPHIVFMVVGTAFTEHHSYILKKIFQGRNTVRCHVTSIKPYPANVENMVRFSYAAYGRWDLTRRLKD